MASEQQLTEAIQAMREARIRVIDMEIELMKLKLPIFRAEDGQNMDALNIQVAQHSAALLDAYNFAEIATDEVIRVYSALAPRPS